MQLQFQTLDELHQYAQDNPIEYLVDNLFKEGTFNLASGEAKSGKSTLVRYLAACVAKGEPFLGRETQKGTVLYICPDETDTTELALAFKRLGVTENLLISPHPVHKELLAHDLEVWVKQLPDVKLVVLDTLAKTIPYKELNGYDDIVRDITPIQHLAERTGAVIVALHHTRKNNGGSITEALMGSGGLGAMAHTIIEVSRYNTRRRIRSQQRYGGEIEYTDIFLDPSTCAISLGASITESKERNTLFRSNELEKDVIAFVEARGKATLEEVKNGVAGKSRAKQQIVEKLFDNGAFTRTGRGVKGDPRVYSLATLRTEEDLKEAA